MRAFTIDLIDMDLADLDTDEFFGLTPTYLRSILLELKRMYKREDELMDILGTLARQGVEIPCGHSWVTEDEYYTYQGKKWILRNVHCEYCLEDNLELGFDQTVEDFQKASN